MNNHPLHYTRVQPKLQAQGGSRDCAHGLSTHSIASLCRFWLSVMGQGSKHPVPPSGCPAYALRAQVVLLHGLEQLLPIALQPT